MKITVEHDDGKTSIYTAEGMHYPLIFVNVKKVDPELIPSEFLGLFAGTPLVFWDQEKKHFGYLSIVLPNAVKPFYIFDDKQSQLTARGHSYWEHARLATPEEIEIEEVIE